MAMDLDLGCEMGPAVFTEIVLPPYILPAGMHTFTIDFTTNDSLFHVDACYELNLVLVCAHDDLTFKTTLK